MSDTSLIGSPRARRRSPARLTLGVALLLVLAPGCFTGLFGSPATISLTGAWGIAVYPIIFHFRMPQYQSYLRAHWLAEHLNTTSSCIVYGPADFHVIDPSEPDPTLGTDMSDHSDPPKSNIRYTRIRPPMGLYAIRITVDRPGVTEADQDSIEAGGGDPNSLIEDSDVTLKADLLSVGDHGIVTSVSGTAHLDATISEDISTDQFSEITTVSMELVDRLVKIGGLRATKERPEMGLTLIPVLGPAAAFHLPGKKNLVTEMSALDAIEREVILSGLTRWIDPEATRERERVYGSSPFGLVVTDSDGVSRRAGVLPNDLLLTVDGERLWGQYVLDRHLVLGPSRVLLKRSGEIREVTLAYASNR